MKAIAFDTLAYSKKLTGAGFTVEQAEVQAEAIAEVINENIATKRDIEELRVATSRDIAELRKELLYEIRQSENRMLIKLGTLVAASIGIVAALVKLL